jgi:hypothetical protein
MRRVLIAASAWSQPQGERSAIISRTLPSFRASFSFASNSATNWLEVERWRGLRLRGVAAVGMGTSVAGAAAVGALGRTTRRGDCNENGSGASSSVDFIYFNFDCLYGLMKGGAVQPLRCPWACDGVLYEDCGVPEVMYFIRIGASSAHTSWTTSIHKMLPASTSQAS